MTTEEKKRAAARAALEYIQPGTIIGVGTGSTANHFIDALAELPGPVRAAVASSEATRLRLEQRGIRVIDLDEAGWLPVYVDGADEANRVRQLIKGGGGALTREKIVAASSGQFVCVVDDSKIVQRLGAFPLPVEVIPIALALVSRAVETLGGRPVRREGFVTDNGNAILDVHGLPLDDPIQVERYLDQIPGVVTNGLFCRRPADVILAAGDGGIEKI